MYLVFGYFFVSPFNISIYSKKKNTRFLSPKIIEENFDILKKNLKFNNIIKTNTLIIYIDQYNQENTKLSKEKIIKSKITYK